MNVIACYVCSVHYGLEIGLILVHFIQMVLSLLSLGSEFDEANVHAFLFPSQFNFQQLQAVISDHRNGKFYQLRHEKKTLCATLAF